MSGLKYIKMFFFVSLCMISVFAICGNGVLERGEECESDSHCAEGFICYQSNCHCFKPAAECGNGVLEEGEECEQDSDCAEGFTCYSSNCHCFKPEGSGMKVMPGNGPGMVPFDRDEPIISGGQTQVQSTACQQMCEIRCGLNDEQSFPQDSFFDVWCYAECIMDCEGEFGNEEDVIVAENPQLAQMCSDSCTGNCTQENECGDVPCTKCCLSLCNHKCGDDANCQRPCVVDCSRRYECVDKSCVFDCRVGCEQECGLREGSVKKNFTNNKPERPTSGFGDFIEAIKSPFRSVLPISWKSLLD